MQLPSSKPPTPPPMTTYSAVPLSTALMAVSSLLGLEGVPVLLAVKPVDGEPDGVGVPEGVGGAEPVSEGVGVLEGVPVGVGGTEPVSEGVGGTEPVREGVGGTEVDPVMDGVGGPLGDTDTDGGLLGVLDADGGVTARSNDRPTHEPTRLPSLLQVTVKEHTSELHVPDVERLLALSV
jgi:hypothetical protein